MNAAMMCEWKGLACLARRKGTSRSIWGLTWESTSSARWLKACYALLSRTRRVHACPELAVRAYIQPAKTRASVLSKVSALWCLHPKATESCSTSRMSAMFPFSFELLRIESEGLLLNLLPAKSSRGLSVPAPPGSSLMVTKSMILLREQRNAGLNSNHGRSC